MMGCLHRLGNTYISQHPDMNPDGERGENALNIDTIKRKTAINPIKISHCFPAVYTFYGNFQDVHRESHPIAMFMEQLRAVIPPPRYEAEHAALLEIITEALIEQGDEQHRVVTGPDHLSFAQIP